MSPMLPKNVLKCRRGRKQRKRNHLREDSIFVSRPSVEMGMLTVLLVRSQKEMRNVLGKQEERGPCNLVAEGNCVLLGGK